MDKDAILAALEGATSEAEWNKICDDVKREHPRHAYPEWWYAAVIASGLGDRKARQFGMATGVQVHSIPRKP